jgi:uncharacterized lipoprotein YmbA
MKLVAKCVFLTIALAGCGSSEPRFYTLQRVSGASEATEPATIEVGRPGLAGYLDRSEIVLKNDAYRISTDDHTRWAEPLGDMIGRVLTQDLSQRLRNSSVYDQGGAITASPDARVEVDIVSFNKDESGSVALNANIAIEQGATHHPMAKRHVTLQATTDNGDPEMLVATMSTLLGTLSDRIATDVRSSTALAAAPAAAPVAMTQAAPPAQLADLAPPPDTPAPSAQAFASNAVPPPVALSAPVTRVTESPLKAGCTSGGKAVPCLQAP